MLSDKTKIYTDKILMQEQLAKVRMMAGSGKDTLHLARTET